jgi:hypothetical protein
MRDQDVSSVIKEAQRVNRFRELNLTQKDFVVVPNSDAPFRVCCHNKLQGGAIVEALERTVVVPRLVSFNPFETVVHVGKLKQLRVATTENDQEPLDVEVL